MNILMITGSPKKNGSASRAILLGLEQYLKDAAADSVITHAHSLDTDIGEKAAACDVLVLAFPLYVDGIPSHLLSVMEQMERSRCIRERTPIYVVVNCGFYEGEQCGIALEMAKHWCERCGAKWGGGLGFGGGGGLDMMDMAPMGCGPKKNLGNALREVAESIVSGAGWEYRFASVNFPAFMYRLGAQSMWRRMAKSNGLRRKDLSRQP